MFPVPWLLLQAVSLQSLVDLLTLHRGHVLKVRTLSQSLDHKTKAGIYFAFLAATDFLSGETFHTEVRPELFEVVTRKHERHFDWTWKGNDISVFVVIRSQKECITSQWETSNVNAAGRTIGVLGILYLNGCEWLTKHSDNSTCFCNSLNVLGYTLVQTLIILLHPLDGQNPVLSQCDPCNAQPLSQNAFKKKVWHVTLETGSSATIRWNATFFQHKLWLRTCALSPHLNRTSNQK